MFDTGAKSVIEKILPVVDNFVKRSGNGSRGIQEDPFVDGMNRIYKQLMTELENIGSKTHRGGRTGIRPESSQRSDAGGKR